MSIVSHFLITTAGVRMLHLEGSDVLFAYLFGVAVDVDHLIKLPLYFRKHKVGFVNLLRMRVSREKHYNWRTSLQEPVALLWIIPLSWFFGSAVPVVFFIGHLLLDYAMSYLKRPLFPFLSFQTRGFLPGVPDWIKESVTVVLSLCILIFTFVG